MFKIFNCWFYITTKSEDKNRNKNIRMLIKKPRWSSYPNLFDILNCILTSHTYDIYSLYLYNMLMIKYITLRAFFNSLCVY